MALLDTIAPEAKGHADRIGGADLVVALPSCQSWEQLEEAAAGLRSLLPDLLPGGKAVILHPDTAMALNGETVASPAGESSLELFPFPMSPVQRYHEQSLDQALRSLFQVGRTLGAKVCVMLGTDSSPECARELAEPVLNQSFDLSVAILTGAHS